MSLLRFYPPDQRDGSGLPLDWSKCRACEGEGRASYPRRGLCTECRGCRSARELILSRDLRYDPETESRTTLHGPRDHRDTLRCEDCSHPMDPGLWSPNVMPARQPLMTRVALESLRSGQPLPEGSSVHYTPCDGRCAHGGKTFGKGGRFGDLPEARRYADDDTRFAAWREVDARALLEPFDLRPPNVAVLCLTCFCLRGAPAPVDAPARQVPQNVR